MQNKLQYNSFFALSRHLSSAGGKLIMMAGCAGMGKTSLMLSLILQAPEKVYLVYTSDLDDENIASKLRSFDALLDDSRPGPYRNNQRLKNLKVVSAASWHGKAHWYDELLLMQQKNCLPDICLVDYKPSTMQEGVSLEMLKSAALQFNIPIIVFSKLERNFEILPFRTVLWENLDGVTAAEKNFVSELWYLLRPEYYADHLCSPLFRNYEQRAFLVECFPGQERFFSFCFEKTHQGILFRDTSLLSAQKLTSLLFSGSIAKNKGITRGAHEFFEKYVRQESIDVYLNALINIQSLSAEVWRHILALISSQLNNNVIWVDFTSVDGQKQENARREKEKFIRSGYFEMAAIQRDVEKEILDKQKFLKENAIEQSCFFCQGKILFYLYLGNGAYDDVLKDYLLD